MNAQQVTITVPDGAQWAVLDALAAAFGPGDFLGLGLRRVAVPNGRGGVPPALGARGPEIGQPPTNDPAVPFEYLDTPTPGLDTKVSCDICGARRSVRMARAVTAWPRCCGQPMTLDRTQAEIRVIPLPDSSPAVPPAVGGTNDTDDTPDGELVRLIAGAGWGVEPRQHARTLHTLRRALHAGISRGHIHRALTEARNTTRSPRGTVMHGVGAVGWMEEETYTTKTGSRTRYRWRWRAVQGPGARESKKFSKSLGTR